MSSARRKFAAVAATAFIALLLGLSFVTKLQSQIQIRNPASQKIRVGSKDFTESVILAEILAQMLEKKGIVVERQFELGGNLAHDALLVEPN